MFRLFSLLTFLVVASPSGGAADSSSSSSSSALPLRDLMLEQQQSSSPQEALIVVQKAIRSFTAVAVNHQDDHHSFMMMEESDRNLVDISETCANETSTAIQSLDLIDFSAVLSDDVIDTESVCTSNSAMTNIQCDVSKIPDYKALVEANCDSASYAYEEITVVVVSGEGIRVEFNNLGICVGSSCTRDELEAYFTLYNSMFDLFGHGDANPDASITSNIEEPGVDTYTSSSSRMMMMGSSSLILVGSLIAGGLMVFGA
jgi:hypothetical protein